MVGERGRHSESHTGLGVKDTHARSRSRSRTRKEKLLLHKLLLSGQYEEFQGVLEDGFDTCQYDRYGRSAIELAATYGKLEYVQLLVEHGFDVNEAHKLGYTALHRAAMWGHENIVRYLLGQGADVTATVAGTDQLPSAIPFSHKAGTSPTSTIASNAAGDGDASAATLEPPPPKCTAGDLAALYGHKAIADLLKTQEKRFDLATKLSNDEDQNDQSDAEQEADAP